mgnify:CR=1 FL=1|tara:strand:+ start:497 stop:1483 length:987 start_codon:yes stop_codon:yes gene_type:complete
MTWGNQTTNTTTKTGKADDAPKTLYNREYYRNLLDTNRQTKVTHRMALVAHENACKTGLALSFLEPEIQANKKIAIFDVDNSARSTVDFVYPGCDNIMVIPLLDEGDDSIYHEDNSVNHHALVNKTKWFINLLAEDIEADPDAWGGIIFDGGSTFLKWCEFAMRQSLLAKGVIENEDDSFNQKEWRERNKMNRDVLDRLHALPVAKIYNTFHLKAVQEYMDDGSGKKVLMTVGERPDWEKGTMRRFSQQIFLSRYMKKADMAAGVKGDKSLGENEWCVRGTIEEMKGDKMEYVGTTHTVLTVKDGTVEWLGMPFIVETESEANGTGEA